MRDTLISLQFSSTFTGFSFDDNKALPEFRNPIPYYPSFPAPTFFFFHPTCCPFCEFLRVTFQQGEQGHFQIISIGRLAAGHV